jgi:uncharacterized protein YneF (UPF0154 family)
MNLITIVLVVVALWLGGLWGFFGYKKTLTEKAIKFKEKMAKAKELE